MGDFGRQEIGVARFVANGDPQQHQQAGLDPTNQFAGYRDLARSDPLNYGAHGIILST
jgi:hypothetical protein